MVEGTRLHPTLYKHMLLKFSNIVKLRTECNLESFSLNITQKSSRVNEFYRELVPFTSWKNKITGEDTILHVIKLTCTSCKLP